jgi:hypothetical protein
VEAVLLVAHKKWGFLWQPWRVKSPTIGEHPQPRSAAFWGTFGGPDPPVILATQEEIGRIGIEVSQAKSSRDAISINKC